MRNRKLLIATAVVLVGALAGVGFFVWKIHFSSNEIDIDSIIRTQKTPREFVPKYIVVYGDSRTGHEIHQKIVDAVIKTNPVAVFHTGDLVDKGSKAEEWKIFNRISSKLLAKTEFYPTLGNHEENSLLYFENFSLPNNERWYRVEKGGIHFIILDSNTKMGEGSEQYEWLKQELKKISEKLKFIIVVLHHPLFASEASSHKEDEKDLQKSLVPLFNKYGVDAVFAGHIHAYERLYQGGIYYIITGGGGAPLHELKEKSPFSQKFIKVYHFCRLYINKDNQMVIEVYDPDLNLLDRFVVENR